MKKSPKPKPEVSGGTGVITGKDGPDSVWVSFNTFAVKIPVILLPVGAKVGDSVICRFQLVRRQDDK